MVHIDVCSESSIAGACKDVSTRHGELYGLINNAGGWLSSAKDTIDLNTYAVINVTEAFLPLLLKKQGGNNTIVSMHISHDIFGSDRSPRRGNLVRACVTFLKRTLKMSF